MDAPEARERDTSSLRTIVSGGAPIAPATVEAFERRFGTYIHNIYGLTETTSPSHCVPIGTRAPVDPASGALSVGVPVYGTVVRVVGEDGRELPAGEVGEIVTSGPQVVPGYWGRPEESEHAIPGGALHTGDVGFMDADGWFYVVDRKKDQINAAGYKVWPREVEDVLYGHPAVREAAVVGVPDAYRGETVKAFVSLRPGERVDADELIAFCRERMAAYKYPRDGRARRRAAQDGERQGPAPRAARSLVSARRHARRLRDRSPLVSHDGDARLRAFARLLVRTGVNLNEGQELLVQAQHEHAAFVRAIAQEAYAAGARFVDVAYADRWVQRAFLETAPDEMLGWTPPWMVARLERAIEVGAAIIGVSADSGAEVYEGLDGERLARARFRDFDRVWMEGVMGRKLAWSLVAYPTEGWAREALG